MSENKSIEKIIQKLPDGPGIYKMLDKGDRVIYVGKANNIKKRVRQYFRKNYQHSTRTRKLVEQIHDIKCLEVDSELEAIILETNLIKQLKPKYNILMKDDKSYVYIKITNEDFPTVKIVRNIEKDGAKYIGPKTAAHKIKETFKMLKKLFPFRHCNLGIELLDETPETKNGEDKYKVKITRKGIKYPCLDYYIKRCIAPCIGKCNKEEYAVIIKNIEDFLEGRGENIINSLQEKMQKLARDKKFEKAAKLRDRIQKVQDILEKQKVSSPGDNDSDIINYYIAHDNAYFNLFQVRDGNLIGQENFTLSASELKDDENKEVLEAFLQQYYTITPNFPKEIIIPHAPDNQTQLEEIISEEAKKKVKLKIPQKGKKHKLLELSAKNALIFADRSKPSWKEASELTIEAAKELAKILKLKDTPKRIECYDISHLSGTDTVGSMVVFKNGAPKNSHYRKFQLRTVKDKADDFKSMEEVLYRRFSKISHEIEMAGAKFKKLNKKEKEELKISEKKENIYGLKLEEEFLGTIRIEEVSKKMTIIKELNLVEENNKASHKIIKEAGKKAKGRRIYVQCKSSEKEKFQIIGFEEIKKVPKELKQSTSKEWLALNKLKLKEDDSFKEIPNLIIIDGGKGQLSSAHKVLKQLNMKIPHISLAKREEEIFEPRKSSSIKLPRNSEALKLIQRARDEAHRFAITYNRKLRSRKLKG